MLTVTPDHTIASTASFIATFDVTPSILETCTISYNQQSRRVDATGT